jgi:transposase-like protein
MKCPRCGSKTKQCKVGFNQSGSQKYRCYECGKNYTPEPNVNGYPAEMRLKAITLYLEGNSFRSIERLLKINHQSVANWVKAYSEQLPKVKLPEQPKVAELDELYTFIGKKKTKSMSSR